MSRLILALAVASLAVAPVSSVSSETGAPMLGSSVVFCDPSESCGPCGLCDTCDSGECALGQTAEVTTTAE